MSLIGQAVLDTRRLHLWVLSGASPHEFLLRLYQYVALESAGMAFGHLQHGAGAVMLGGFRNFVSREVGSTIAYNAKHVKKVLEIEKNIIAFAAYCRVHGKEAALALLSKIRGGASSSTQSLVLKPSYYYRFNENCNTIYANIIREHTLRDFSALLTTL